MSRKKGKPKVYVVQRLGWRVWKEDRARWGEDRAYLSRCEEDTGLPVAAFLTSKAAQACRDRLESEARRELAPVAFFEDPGQVCDDLSEEEVVERVKVLGLPPPPEVTRQGARSAWTVLDWVGWWDAVAAGLSDAQREAVWNIFDDLRLYEVVPTELEE